MLAQLLRHEAIVGATTRARRMPALYIAPPAAAAVGAKTEILDDGSPRVQPDPPGSGATVRVVARHDEVERYEAALRRRRLAEFVAQWGVCERGHVLTDLNRDTQGRCWCCTRGHERAFEASRSGWESIPMDS